MANKKITNSNLADERYKQALEKCDELIRDFSNRADRNKIRFRRLQFSGIGLGVCTTLLSALAIGRVLGNYDWIVPLISGLATLTTTMLGQTNTQKIWIGSRSASQRFQSEKFLFLQDGGEYKKLKTSAEKIKRFSEKIIFIWEEAQETWSQYSNSKS